MTWRSSSFSGAGGGNNNCVEVAHPTPTTVHLRDTKNPTPTLRVPTHAFTSLLTKVG
ncbi:DUF397 domain-containing protein [Actinokineospora globicatena]|uniref:DUF397 domain-containing protein n=1 Tax=Actinokineospora globicatena TaxID=103729 RepID=UPI0020A53BC5|nr:DUF397 domain-containing protein [Actinokineospora globicatena]MCP2305047.1 protein of unknown function (DUF397) [Actinokineospora globicatena]GLW80512.1 hypothetical protein Aglo01_49930 [Actinokineospora globicatena]GLW87340.1 hypothetical protein Aglo02_49790 [Actinokineospora globicatena]